MRSVALLLSFSHAFLQFSLCLNVFTFAFWVIVVSLFVCLHFVLCYTLPRLPIVCSITLCFEKESVFTCFMFVVFCVLHVCSLVSLVPLFFVSPSLSFSVHPFSPLFCVLKEIEKTRPNSQRALQYQEQRPTRLLPFTSTLTHAGVHICRPSNTFVIRGVNFVHEASWNVR